MTLLTMIQDCCKEVGVPAPTVAFTSQDTTIQQMIAISNSAGMHLAQLGPWQELTRETTHTTVAAELQGLMSTIAPGFNWPLYETMWNRTSTQYLWGPLFPREWQFLKAIPVTGPFPNHRIYNRRLYFIPAPTAGETVAFEYMSNYWCESSGGTGQSRWAADTDTSVLPEEILKRETIWRWKAAKGFDYAEDFRSAQEQANNNLARSQDNRSLFLNGNPTYQEPNPGVFVPWGNWTGSP